MQKRNVATFSLLGLSLLLGVAGCGKKQSGTGLEDPDYILKDTGEPASKENPQVISGDRFEDYYYAFTMRRPNDRWEFLTEEKTASINPDAAMGMIAPSKNAYVAVIVEQAADTSLEDYGGIIFDPAGILGATGAPAKPGKVGDLDSLEKETPAIVAGAPFHYRVTLLRRGDFFYQIIGWTIESKYQAARADIESIIDSFRPVDDREPELRANLRTTDDNGFGWHIKDGVYSNAANGFRIPAPEGCRLMSLSEIVNVNPDASLGIAGGFGEFFQYWFVESGGDGEALAKHYLATQAAEMGGTVGGQRTVRIGGEDATEATIEGAQTGNLALDYRLTWIQRGDTLYRLLSHWQPSTADAAQALLERSYAAVEWLGSAEQAALADEFREAGYDPGNSVGMDFAFRNGTFHDFAGGFRYEIPRGSFFGYIRLSQPLEGLAAQCFVV